MEVTGGFYEDWKKRELAKLEKAQWLTPHERESIRRSILNLRNDWREGFRTLLLNMYGVRLNGATSEQLRAVLDKFMRDEWRIVQDEMTREEFLSLIRDIFADVLGRIEK
jgi:hypothetical protein